MVNKKPFKAGSKGSEGAGGAGQVYGALAEVTVSLVSYQFSSERLAHREPIYSHHLGQLKGYPNKNL